MALPVEEPGVPVRRPDAAAEGRRDAALRLLALRGPPRPRQAPAGEPGLEPQPPRRLRLAHPGELQRRALHDTPARPLTRGSISGRDREAAPGEHREHRVVPASRSPRAGRAPRGAARPAGTAPPSPRGGGAGPGGAPRGASAGPPARSPGRSPSAACPRARRARGECGRRAPCRRLRRGRRSSPRGPRAGRGPRPRGRGRRRPPPARGGRARCARAPQAASRSGRWAQVRGGANLHAGRGRHLGQRLAEPLARRPELEHVAVAVPAPARHPVPRGGRRGPRGRRRSRRSWARRGRRAARRAATSARGRLLQRTSGTPRRASAAIAGRAGS